MPADRYFIRQWHLDNDGQSGGVAGIDANVVDAWRDYTGAGVTVGIWDDGVEYGHPDLDGNYDPALHISVGGRTHDPAPQHHGSMHGTAVAGLIAAEADGVGTVGVAHGATIAAVDIFHDPALDIERSFQELRRFDVTSHSWGYTRPFADNPLDPGWSTFFAGWRESVAEGRGGLGTINLVAAGNNRDGLRHGNDSGLVNMPETIAVAAVSQDGSVAYYSTPGASLLVAGPSNGAPGAGIWTTDRTGDAGYNDGTPRSARTPGPAYTADFGGTSAATPIVAGVVALMLEANPLLGWRDVQAILAMSARHVGAEVGERPAGFEHFEWAFNGASAWNGGGLHFSNDYGFGLVDGLAAVRLAETWTGQRTSGNLVTRVADTWSGHRPIPDNDARETTLRFDAEAAVDLEAVAVRLDIAQGYSGDYRIALTSPAGTRSLLATAHDRGDSATDSWIFTSNAFRGEDGVGRWTLEISDRWALDHGTLTSAELTFHGALPGRADTYVFTDEYSDLADGRFGHRTSLRDPDGGRDALNAAAVGAPSAVDLARGAARIDGIAVRLDGSVADVFTGDRGDVLLGDDGANALSAGRGQDRIGGRAGDDVLDGGHGRDTLGDGLGSDLLIGGGGRDVFALGQDGSADRVADFQLGRDLVRFPGLAFRDLDIEDLGEGSVGVAHDGDRLVLADGGAGVLSAGALSEGDFLFA